MQVCPFILSDHHPIITQIILKGYVALSLVSEENFSLNTNILDDQEVRTTLYMVRQINKWHNHLIFVINKWNRNVASWKTLL